MQDEELDSVRVVGDDGTWLSAIEFRLSDRWRGHRGPRRVIGGRPWRLCTGEVLDTVDRDAFIVRATGELLHRL